jgi:hypothetical protein
MLLFGFEIVELPVRKGFLHEFFLVFLLTVFMIDDLVVHFSEEGLACDEAP